MKSKNGSCIFFQRMMDEMVELSEYDLELADNLKWLDRQAQKKQISFYDMAFDVLYRHDINEKAKAWLRDRN